MEKEKPFWTENIWMLPKMDELSTKNRKFITVLAFMFTDDKYS